jgi:hypothetical protein
VTGTPLKSPLFLSGGHPAADDSEGRKYYPQMTQIKMQEKQ